MRRVLIFIFVAVVFFTGLLVFRVLPQVGDRGSQAQDRTSNDTSTYKQAQLSIGSSQFLVDIADTPKKRILGLSGRGALLEGQGMLFVFSESTIQGFWMKDMKFSIDIVWISGGKIVGFAERAMPDDRLEREVYYSPGSVDMVLEIGAGEVARLGIRVGDVVTLNFKYPIKQFY